MAVARVVEFEDVGSGRIAELKQSIEAGERPEGLPVTELMILHDAGASRAFAIMLFDSEEDYAKGDEVMNAMPTEGTPGRRVSVTKCDVAVRVHA